MKKVIFVAVLALAMASCRNTVETTEEAAGSDSTFGVVDSVTVDSAVIDTTVVAPGHVPAE
jgi:predicted small secreted protein